jgi:hypothetical protein
MQGLLFGDAIEDPYAAIKVRDWARRILLRFDETGPIGGWLLEREAAKAGKQLRELSRKRGDVFKDGTNDCVIDRV